MASDLSKLPLRLEVVINDDNFPSSVHKVLSNDDLLMVILLRLPILWIHLLKRVCKQWLSLITSPRFILTRTRIRTVDPTSGLFIRRWLRNSEKYYDYDFVSFDPRVPAKRSIEPLVRSGRIEKSCNGLLLCYIGCNKYVCNPSVSMLKMLPPIHDLNYISYGYGYEEINIAFDPTKSPFYKVIHCGKVENDDYYDDEIAFFIRIQTYSSETGFWSVSNDRYPYEWFEKFSNGIYWNSAIHWLNSREPVHVKLDIVDHPVLKNIPIPLPLTVEGQVHRDRKLYKSVGSLLLLCKDYDSSRHLKIYEMKNEYSGWSVKYFVNLDDMMKSYPTWKIPTNWRCRHHILSVVLGEQDEDSFMVIELSGKILQYKCVLETLSEIFDLGKANYKRDYFEYIASFAHA